MRKLTKVQTKKVLLMALRQQVKRLNDDYNQLLSFEDSWTVTGYDLHIKYLNPPKVVLIES